MYYITAIVSLISATLGVLFSIVFVRKEKENSRTNALYMFARSLALLLIAVIPLFINSIQILTIVTAAMCVVQIVDGFIGIAIKNRFQTFGPFMLAVCHGICLLIILFFRAN